MVLQLEKPKEERVLRVLEYVAGLLVIGAIVYAVINGILAGSVGLKGGAPVLDLEASLVVGVLGILLYVALAIYRRFSG